MSISIPNGFAITEYDRLASTNQQASILAHLGEVGPLIIYTKNQTQGRGRSGRAWLSSDKSLTATFLISTKAPKKNVAQLAFVMAVAAHQSICKFLHASKTQQVGLKWPNDVLVNGRKIAGILIESFNIKDNPDSVLAIGIGINIGDSPQDGDFSATSMHALGADVTIEAMLSKLSHNFSQSLDLWAESNNFSQIRDLWLKEAIGLGGQVTARLPNQSIHGVFERLDENGVLMLRDQHGNLHSITAGDVFIGHI